MYRTKPKDRLQEEFDLLSSKPKQLISKKNRYTKVYWEYWKISQTNPYNVTIILLEERKKGNKEIKEVKEIKENQENYCKINNTETKDINTSGKIQ